MRSFIYILSPDNEIFYILSPANEIFYILSHVNEIFYILSHANEIFYILYKPRKMRLTVTTTYTLCPFKLCNHLAGEERADCILALSSWSQVDIIVLCFFINL